MNKTLLRISLDTIIFLSLFIFPWWVGMFLAVVGILFLSNFYEIFLVGYLLDILYGTSVKEFYGIWFVFTLLSIVIYIITERLKKSIRFYETI